jgi:hypothetical protein
MKFEWIWLELSDFDEIWLRGSLLHLEDRSTHERILIFKFKVFWLIPKGLIWKLGQISFVGLGFDLITLLKID